MLRRQKLKKHKKFKIVCKRTARILNLVDNVAHVRALHAARQQEGKRWRADTGAAVARVLLDRTGWDRVLLQVAVLFTVLLCNAVT